MVIVIRQAATGGLAAGLMYGAGPWADRQRRNTGKEGTICRAFFGPAAAALRAVAASAVPVAVLVLLVSGCAVCVALVVLRGDHHAGELPAEGSGRKQTRG
ncbi:hypothetical protein RVR_7918 [Actinacidiphila reveromycinica]|uniref:Uncharacterized protein n=2 Tax=Actinacidiphila reveromycinica TaxID=659352 RepID=A0A7U3UXV2_9ACTN|nr:hypothetical protein RVR_7918 [Streptomyces sp. SN-593]